MDKLDKNRDIIGYSNDILTINKLEILLEEFVKENNFENNLLFKQLDQLKPRKLGFTLAPFYFAVSYWLDNLQLFYMNLINISDNEYAELVKENICDEFGIENGIVDIKKSHKITYTNFLSSLGYKNRIIITPAVEKFNKELENSLYQNRIQLHACILGAIEYFYISISTMLKEYCDKNGIEQSHYKIHEILDKKHSMDLFKVAINYGANIDDFKHGLWRGYGMLWNVYENLWKEYDD